MSASFLVQFGNLREVVPLDAATLGLYDEKSETILVRIGLKRTTLNSKLKKLGIERSDYMQG